MSLSSPILSVERVAYRYRRAQSVLEDISLSLMPGEFVGILGRNGAGKSTLLRIMAGLVMPSNGEVRLKGQPMDGLSPREIARTLAYVPQQKSDHFAYQVRELVAMGRVPHRGVLTRLNDEDNHLVDEALSRLDIAALAQRPVTSLSGGERQRVNIARALVQQAELLLLDEPMAGLDPGSQSRLLKLLDSLASEGRTIVMTSHYPEELFAHASRALILDQKGVLADGSPDDVIDAERMSTLYQVALGQVDDEGRRFFYPRD